MNTPMTTCDVGAGSWTGIERKSSFEGAVNRGKKGRSARLKDNKVLERERSMLLTQSAIVDNVLPTIQLRILQVDDFQECSELHYATFLCPSNSYISLVGSQLTEGLLCLGMMSLALDVGIS